MIQNTASEEKKCGSGGEKGKERSERHRSEKNKIPDYESLFTETDKRKAARGGSGFISKNFRRDWFKHIVSTLFYIIKSSPAWIIPLVTADVVDTVTALPEGYVTRLIIDGVIILVLLAQNIPTHMVYASIVNKMLRRTAAGIRGSVVRKLQRLSITYHHEMESGRIQSKFLRDIDMVDNYYRNVVTTLVPGIIGVIVSVGISLFKSPLVTLFFVLIVPLNLINVWAYGKTMRRNNTQFRIENERMSSKLTNLLQMLPLSKAHGLENEERREMERRIDDVTRAGLKLDRAVASFGSISWVVSSALSMACLFFCAFLAIKGYISVGDVVLFQSLFASINGSLTVIVNVFPALSSGKESVSSLSELMRAEDVEGAGGNKMPPSIEGRVDFNHVSYRYPDGESNVINDFDLHVRAGECIAFVGSSGSGKSTIANLLIGLLEPTEGSVEIDGVPLSEISRQVYRRYLSVVPQNSILFAGSIRENITFGLSAYSEEDLQRAVEAAAVSEFLPSFPHGLDTNVGEHGDKLSGGQKQRVCIARALIRSPKILIMDEATSALDNVSEHHVQKAIEQMTKAGTTFIVAHRLSTIRNADRIVVMENGRAVEIGGYDELMARGGRFSELERLNRIKEEE